MPPDEDQRLAELRQLDMMLTTPEDVFDAITRELARIFEVPGAFITFIGEDTQYYKSAVGLPAEMVETRTEPREISVCNHVVGKNETLVVEDLLADERFVDNPVVLDSGARFYAGTPLRSDNGRALGSLCIVDVQPRRMGPREKDLLRLVAEVVMAQVKLQIASRRLLERTMEVENDLQQAMQVQRFLLPSATVDGEGWEISHLYQPVSHLGGDFVDVHQQPDGRCMVLVADVTGHGASAALTAAMVKTAFLRAAQSVDQPARVLSAVHRDLTGIVRPGQFMSALAAVFDPGQREVAFASAGHPFPLLISPSCAEPVLHENELLLLVRPGMHYDHETTVMLPAGNRFLIYTDGVTEARDRVGKMLGVAGLSELVRKSAGLTGRDFLNALIKRLLHFSDNALRDDVALLCVESN